MKVYAFLSIFLLSQSFSVHGGKNITKEHVQKRFFAFATELFLISAKLSSKRFDHTEPLSEIYFRLDKKEIDKIVQKLLPFRDVMFLLPRVPNLHRVEKIPLLPNDLYHQIIQLFSIQKEQEIDKNELVMKIIGGTFSFTNHNDLEINGLLKSIEEFDMNSWQPVKKFIENFRDTLTMDTVLAEQLGTSLLPMVENYFIYMDPISRLKIFKEVAAGYNLIPFEKSNTQHNINELAILVFQNCGPVMIKLLQQLQEEVVGINPMTEVLKGLKDSQPMSPERIEKITKREIVRLTGDMNLKRFYFEKKPLGIASIAQTHLFEYEGTPYVVKYQKPKISQIFTREQTNLRIMVESEEIFDKGMKQLITNTSQGILEELDFNFERQNIFAAKKCYKNEHKILSVSVPKIFHNESRPNREVLIMSFAQGRPLGKIMEIAHANQLSDAYDAMKNLYKLYLNTALSNDNDKNFYHGDLHRENIFFDPSRNTLTLIDFGNAGHLDQFAREAIIDIYKSAEFTSQKDHETLIKGIIALRKSLRAFILHYHKEQIQKNPIKKTLIDTYFNACFNPTSKLRDQSEAIKTLTQKKHKLFRTKQKIKNLVELHGDLVSSKKLEIVQDDIDFIDAMLGNCLNGSTNILMSTLASQSAISQKLSTVFRELQKNGIAMPKEVIFFNKSKSLLEGLLTNISNKLEKINADYDYTSPYKIYRQVLKAIETDK